MVSIFLELAKYLPLSNLEPNCHVVASLPTVTVLVLLPFNAFTCVLRLTVFVSMDFVVISSFIQNNAMFCYHKKSSIMLEHHNS